MTQCSTFKALLSFGDVCISRRGWEFDRDGVLAPAHEFLMGASFALIARSRGRTRHHLGAGSVATLSQLNGLRKQVVAAIPSDLILVGASVAAEIRRRLLQRSSDVGDRA